MYKFPHLKGILPLSLLALGCNEAKFNSGAAESRPTPPPLSFSCTVKPETTQLGKTVEIAVTSSQPFADKLFEKIKFADRSVDLELTAKDGGYQLKDGPNQFKPEVAGAHTVELRKSADGPVEGSCSFTVEKSEEPACKVGEQLIGGNVAFIIDNSYSHSVTDCQDIDRRLWDSQKKVRCQQATNREKAVLSAFDVLNQISRESGSDALATSALAIASFPTRDESVNGMKIHTNGWITANAEVRNEIANSLLFTREPIGYTPYGAGMRAAETLFANQQGLDAQKSKLAVLVTDGEPTDRNPAETNATAQKLQASGVEVVTVFVTSGQTRSQRRSSHIEFLRKEDQNWLSATNGRDNWYDRRVYGGFESYINDLMGNGTNPQLVDKISSKYDQTCQDSSDTVCPRKIIEVSNSAELEKVFRQIVKNSTRCE